MSDELRGVADRLRRLKAGKELSQDIYGVATPPTTDRAAYQEACREVKRRMVVDERAAVAAFLEAYPADDAEPANFEWLVTIARREFDAATDQVWWEIGALSFTCKDYQSDPGEPVETVATDWRVDDEKLPAMLVPRTRGDLRRLMALCT